MPRISDYGAPETESQAPMEISARPIEEAGQMGRAVQNFGREVSQIEDKAAARAAQEEAADAQYQGANLRAAYSDKLNQQIQQGTVDTEGLMADYQKQVDSTSDKFETSHGQLAFERQATLTKSMLLRSAVSAKSKLAGAQAKAKILGSIDADSSALENDPSSFPAVIQANKTSIDDQVAVGGLPANIADKIKHESSVELAKGAVRGWAKMDPDTADKMLNQGAFDAYFNGDTKAQMQGYINTVKSAKATDLVRQDMVERKAKEKRAEAWKIQNLDRMEKGLVTGEEVVKAAENKILGYDDAKEQLSMIHKVATEKMKSNPAIVNSLTRRIFADDSDPNKITNSAQIDSETAKGNINIRDRNMMVRLIDDTPEGRDNKQNKNRLYKFMEAQLVKKDSMTGMSDPMGEENMANATRHLQEQVQEYTKAGKNVKDLYDPQNKDSFYNQVLQYKLSSKDVMRANVQQMKAQSGALSAVRGADKTQAVIPRATNVDGNKEDIGNWINRIRSQKEKTK